jgi:dTDP-4-dehydrorhamnose 3,5-epimerase
MISVTSGQIPGVRHVRPTAQHDRRGRFVKILQQDVYSQHGVPTHFAEVYYSISENNVLRGLHFQIPPHDHYKLVTCVEGNVFDVIVDLRKDSPQYGHHEVFDLDGARGDSVFVPAGCAHGFYVRSKSATMLYSVSTVYVASHDSGIRWDSAGVPWPVANPIVSDRDAGLMSFADFATPFRLGSA